MVKVRPGRLDALIREGSRSSVYARNVTAHINNYLSACQLGITLASLALGWIGEPAVASMLAPLFEKLELPAITGLSFVVAFSLITALHIVLGELMPKTVSIQSAETVALFTAMPLVFFYNLMYPFIWLLNTLSNKLLSLIGISVDTPHEAAHSEEELRQLFEESHKSGLIDHTEMSLIDNVIDFSDRTAKEIMIPRTDMLCLYTNNSFEQNLDIALREQLTRYPVCQTDKDDIIGFVHIKDLLYRLIKENKTDINSIIRSLDTVPETISISDLFKKMQKKRAQIVLLIDEYGGTAGMVTLEDIVEQVFGEIQDEFDEEREPVEKKPDGYSVDGLVLVEDVNSLLEIELDKSIADTIGGWLYCQLGIDPAPGQCCIHDGYEFEVEEAANLRVTRISIKQAAVEPSAE